ncbi:LuxR family transcriptional regulator [Streptomyces albofaciens JCM 4342]|uniref:ATP-binding protein n=1 Tax=Streptomyces albofaciens TaxID=66866 RepID=UPI001239BEE5|nr:ATP-binding protein [Streptomyces albofaciens]KAA6223468.1 LuxR family transcriptional regulator [Streptomyces albofaciens JCM 4342]
MSSGAEDPPPPGITGRAAERSALRGLLARTPLVTVTGPANVGKSTLARAVLEEAARHDGRPGGFVRVGCRENVTGDGVTAALNRAAGLPYDTAPQALAAYCARHGLTVLLDDCDPVAGACAWLVRQLLRAGTGHMGVARHVGVARAGAPAADDLRIVATARQPLGVGAERVVEVRRVRPDGAGASEPEVIAPELPGIAPEPSGIAPKLPGIAPASYAIAPELYGAATLAPYVPAGDPGPPSSPAPLTAADRLVWARLSTLPGDFDGWLAGCVGISSDVPAKQVEAALERLLRASVLVRVRDTPTAATARAADPGAPRPRPPAPPRYRLPAAARTVGLARLRAVGEEAAALRAFRMACAALAAEAQIAWQGPDRRSAVQLVETEQHNLRAALTRPPLDPADARTALDTAVSLWFRWAVCGRRREGRAHLGRLLRRCGEDAAVRARALWLAGWLAAQDHAHRTAESLLDRATHAAARHADADTLARVAHARGVLALRRADTGTAVAWLRRAVEHAYQDVWYGPGPAYSQVLLAIALAASGPAGVPAPGSVPAAVPLVPTRTAQKETRSGPLPGPRCGHGLT